MSDKCFLCLVQCDRLCPDCQVPYCGPDHLKIHRPNERCLPFKVEEREGVGRYVVATRDIEALEVILEDQPAVFGPDHDTVPVCLECLARVDGSYLCPDCQMPLCGPDCYNSSQYHRQAECPLLANSTGEVKLKVKFGRESLVPGTEAYAPEYQCLTPLRLLSKKSTDPELWTRVQMLMDHDEERRQEVEYWCMFKRNVVDFLRIRLGFDQFSEEDIFRAIGILRTNAFCVETDAMKAQKVGARAVYPTFSFLSHSCICNARYSVFEDKRLVLRAQTPIKAGDEITIQYISFMYGHIRRKKDIKACWFFDCTCPRCKDPTELGSFMSAVRCLDKDCSGDVLPKDAMKVNDDWICSECGKTQSGKSIEDLCNNCNDELHNTYGHDIERYEKLIDDFSLRLKPSHYIMLTVKKFLGDLYGLRDGFEYRKLSPERLNKKIDYLRKEFQRKSSRMRSN